MRLISLICALLLAAPAFAWGASLDATYTGTAGRNMEMYYDLNAVQDGVRYVDLNPPAHDPGSTSPTAVLPPEFLRPYSGYQSIRVRGNSATSDYHALQLQVNRGGFADSTHTFTTELDPTLSDAARAALTAGLVSGRSILGVPEPETWALMMLGFFGVGGALRRRRGLAALA